MKNLFIYFALALLFVVAPMSSTAQTADWSAKLAEIDAYAQKVQKDWNVPGMAIGIVKDDKVIFAKGYGVRELGKPEKVDENTVFAVASNSKAFTTALLAMLVDEGKLSWDDKVIKHLPEFQLADPFVTREMTIRDLVSHRSGFATFSGDLLWYETTYSDEDIIKRLRYLKPTTSFRSAYGYQNLMFTVAGKVLERVSGKPWRVLVRERILNALGMSNTKVSITEFKNGDNMAMPHNEHSGKLASFPVGNVDNAAAAAGLGSTVRDMAQWLRLQLGRGKFEGKQFFSERQAWEMHQPNIFIPISANSAKNNPTRHFYGYGLGWFLNDYQGRKVVSHGGGLDGMISQTAMMPEENLGLVVLTNSETTVNTIMQNKIFDVFTSATARDWSAERLALVALAKDAETTENKKIDESRIPNTKPTLDLAKYAGTYSGDLYGDAKVSVENGKLVLRLVPAPRFVADLEHWHYDTFRIKWRDSVVYNFPRGFVNFTIDKNGQPSEMKIDQPNNDFWFYELELRRKN